MSRFFEILSYDNIVFLLKGAGISLIVAIFSLLFGLLNGTIAASFRLSRSRLLQLIAKVYIEIIRGTPMLLQLTFMRFAVPALYQQITHSYLRVDPLILGIIAISVNSGAYVAELIRGAINAVDKGQWEASTSLNLSYYQTLRLIILPQAFKYLVPSLTSELIMLVKDSSLISAIGAVELMHHAKILGVNYYDYTTPLLGAGVIYFLITLIISKLSSKLESRLLAND